MNSSGITIHQNLFSFKIYVIIFMERLLEEEGHIDENVEGNRKKKICKRV